MLIIYIYIYIYIGRVKTEKYPIIYFCEAIGHHIITSSCECFEEAEMFTAGIYSLYK